MTLQHLTVNHKYVAFLFLVDLYLNLFTWTKTICYISAPTEAEKQEENMNDM